LKEKDILTKAGIIIQSQTGLRINEVLSILQGCVHTTNDGYNYMEVTLGKTEKGEPIIHKIFINELGRNAVEELEEYTKDLREKSGLKEFVEKKNKGTIDKVNKVIDKLKRSKTKKINFKTVAEEAGVSKATLYNNDILKERILSLRAIKKGVPNDSIVAKPKDKINAKDDKIKQLYEKIKKLKEDKEKLIIQLVKKKKLKDENKRLRESLDKIKSM